MTFIFEYMGEIVEAKFQYLKQSIIELEAQITHPLITCMIDKCKEIMRLQESLCVGFPGPKDFYNNFKDISCNCRHLLQAMKDYNWDIYDQNREKVGKIRKVAEDLAMTGMLKIVDKQRTLVSVVSVWGHFSVGCLATLICVGPVF